MTDLLTAGGREVARGSVEWPLTELSILVDAARDLAGGSLPDSTRSLAAGGILETVADRLAAMAERDEGALHWHLLRARDHVESHLIALAHLRAARVSPSNLLGALRRAVDTADQEVAFLAATASAGPGASQT
jgi:hypothetical protein